MKIIKGEYCGYVVVGVESSPDSKMYNLASENSTWGYIGEVSIKKIEELKMETSSGMSLVGLLGARPKNLNIVFDD
jgi:hypothetical protein